MANYGLAGTGPLAYQGVRAATPPNMIIQSRAPTQNDVYNVVLGTYWLYPHPKTQTDDPINSQLWILAGQQQSVATWIELTSNAFGTVQTLTGNLGGAVGPNINGNIFTVGDNEDILVTGDPGSNTLTATLITDFVTEVGIANTSGGALNIVGLNGISTSGTGNTVTLSVVTPAAGIVSTLTGNNTSLAVPSDINGNINVIGSVADPDIYITGNPVSNTLTATLITAFTGDSGAAYTSGGVLNINGGADIDVTAAGNTVTIAYTGGGGGGGFNSINVQIFDTPGTFTYTPSASMQYAIIEGVGGGAGTGGSGCPNVLCGASSGGYCKITLDAATIGASQTLTVGAGGTASGSVSGTYPTGGGDTTFGAGPFFTAGGAQPTSIGGSSFAAGTPGTAVGGDINIPGQSGYSVFTKFFIPVVSTASGAGNGGSTPLGLGGQGQRVVGSGSGQYYPGNPGTGYGSGGSGASSNNGSTPFSGVNGQGGAIIITEFCT